MILYYHYDNIIIVINTVREGKEIFAMKKVTRQMLIIASVTLVCLIAALFFLPDEIPLHYGARGADMIASKYYVLLLTPVPAFLFWAAVRKLKK